MFKFLEARSDLHHLEAFYQAVADFWRMETEAGKETPKPYPYDGPHEWQQAVAQKASELYGAEYFEARKKVAEGVNRAEMTAHRLGVKIQWVEMPAPAIGGPFIPTGLFSSILFDPSRSGVKRIVIIDTFHKAIGAARSSMQHERLKLINPLNWVWGLLAIVLRIPLRLIEATGFDIKKVEDHLVGK